MTHTEVLEHLQVVEALLDAALQAQCEIVREHLCGAASDLDPALVRELLNDPKYKSLPPLAENRGPVDADQAVDLTRGGPHAHVVEALLDAALQAQHEVARRHLYGMALVLDPALVRKLLNDPKFKPLHAISQMLFSRTGRPSAEVRERALALHAEHSQVAFLSARKKI